MDDDALANALTAVVVVVVPLAAGGALGAGLRRVRGARWSGGLAVLLLLGLPAAALLGAWWLVPAVGLWDALVLALLVGAGALGGAHAAFGDPRRVRLAVLALGLGLAGVELGVRVLLPRPPAFATGRRLHLRLRDALRAEPRLQFWDSVSKDVVCTVAYPTYAPMFERDASREVVTPAEYAPRAGVARRVLHVGDSMTFGFGVERDETFVAALGRAEPDVEHVDAAVPGIAPDAYYLLVRGWTAKQRFDAVVMHVYEENDVDGIDASYPCCDFRPLVAYDGGVARPACAEARAGSLRHAGWEWVRFHSPPPYALRALVGTSSAASYLASALVAQPFLLAAESIETRLAHLEAIVRATRDELRARGTALLIVVLPGRRWVDDPTRARSFAREVVAISERAGVPVLDASDLLRAARLRGEPLYPPSPGDAEIHYAPRGHEIVAEWLHARWADAAKLRR